MKVYINGIRYVVEPREEARPPREYQSIEEYRLECELRRELGVPYRGSCVTTNFMELLLDCHYIPLIVSPFLLKLNFRHRVLWGSPGTPTEGGIRHTRL